jgi:hypothetical protein
MTKVYILSIFSSPEKIKNLSGQSITLLYADALARNDFAKFNTIGDHLLFIEAFAPLNLNGAEPEYYETVAQMSYYQCYKLTKRKLYMYEELADNFNKIVNKMRYMDFSITPRV